MSKIQLFHYSVESYPVLKTALAQGNVSQEDARAFNKWAANTSDVMGYHHHISFFIQQHPVEDITKFYPGGHPIWFKGNVLIEHLVEVDVNAILLFKMVETKTATALHDSIVWSGIAEWAVIKYKKRLHTMQRKIGEIGRTGQQLQKQILNNAGDILPALQNLHKRDDYITIRNKYAATIPHVMVYPHSGSMPVVSHRTVTVG